MDSFGFSHDVIMKNLGLKPLLYGVDINYMRFLTSFGMTAILFFILERKGRQSRPFLLQNIHD